MRPQDHEMELEPGPPNQDDACMVCDKIECVCKPDETLEWLLSLPKDEADQMRDIITKMSRREEREAKDDATNRCNNCGRKHSPNRSCLSR